MMHPGFYVVRLPSRGMGQRLIIESRPFAKTAPPGSPPGLFTDPTWFRKQAENWCDFIQSQHPKDDVFVIER